MVISEILIILENIEIPFKISSNGEKLYELPFEPHTCFSTLDLFKTPSSRNYRNKDTWTVKKIDDEITKGGKSLSTRNRWYIISL